MKTHQLELLRYLVHRNSPAPAESLDGRTLRPLKGHGLVFEADGQVSATELGRTLINRAPATAQQDPKGGVLACLSDQQEEVLRYLLRQTGPVPEEHIDGRVLRALRAQNLIVERAGWVSPGEGAQACLAQHVERSRAPRHRRTTGPSTARADAICRAVNELEAALPRDLEIYVADVPAYADDVLTALRRFAKEMGAQNAATIG